MMEEGVQRAGTIVTVFERLLLGRAFAAPRRTQLGGPPGLVDAERQRARSKLARRCWRRQLVRELGREDVSLRPAFDVGVGGNRRRGHERLQPSAPFSVKKAVPRP